MDQKPFGTSDFALNPEPRCPCLLLLDVSASMEGAPIAELNAGLKAFRDDLVADELASKRVEVACITFGGTVDVVTEFETAGAFQPPWLKAADNTPMGAALTAGIEHYAFLKYAKLYEAEQFAKYGDSLLPSAEQKAGDQKN